MILVDTNVVSELMRASPDARVVAWLDSLPADDFFLSAVSLAELASGVAVLPEGQRKTSLGRILEGRLIELFAGRVLPFDAEGAYAYARIVANARARGVAIGVADGQIAATALVHRLSVATRDTLPFLAAGLTVFDPLTAATPG